MPSLPKLDEVERLSARVIRILGGNPGKFTLQGTNTYLLGTGPHRLLIDTGEGLPSWASALHRTLKEENATISHALLTHWHHDHVGGVQQLRELVPGVRVWKFGGGGRLVDGGQGPGHTNDHIALLLKEENAMFTGDNVLGHGTAVFEDLSLYLSSLSKMRNAWLEEEEEEEEETEVGLSGGRAYPGHGPVLEDGKATIKEYITHRQQREDEVVALLSKGSEDGVWTAMELVKVIYRDVPVELHGPAERGVGLILGKLRGEGRVEGVTGGRWRLIKAVDGREKL